MNLNENRATGFTLIEIMVVISVFGLILTAVMMLFLQGTKTYRQSVTMAQMRFRTQKAIDDMKSELVDARLIDSNNRLDTISFQRPTPVEDALGAVDAFQPDIGRPQAQMPPYQVDIEGIVFGRPSGESPRSLKRWLEARQGAVKQPVPQVAEKKAKYGK